MEPLSTLLQHARSQGIVFIDPRIDYAFKLIFGTPGNEDLHSEYRGSYLEKMFQLSNFASMDEMSQREYLARFMWEVDQRSQLRSARNEGLAEGRAEGRAALMETARRMVADGLDLAIIQKYTGLSPTEINSLVI